MSLIETRCPKCNKKIFLDLEEIVTTSSSSPIKCSQCGNEFIFGFDSDAIVISDESAVLDNGETPVIGAVSHDDTTSNIVYIDTSDTSSTAANTVDAERFSEEPEVISEEVITEPSVDPTGKKKLVKKVIVKKVKKQKPKANKKVLIIEDSTLTRLQIAEMFSELVTDVIEAGSAEDGLVELKKGKPDLLIVDLLLPRMSGLELVNRIKKYIPADRIIIFTGAQDMFLDIFNEGMEGLNLIQKGGPDTYETLREKGSDILQIQ
ncbi:MAG: response regulator [Deltaproteobacteria bacterium]|nr:response regulator [Candidatus Zymogenaceae bacterium]